MLVAMTTSPRSIKGDDGRSRPEFKPRKYNVEAPHWTGYLVVARGRFEPPIRRRGGATSSFAAAAALLLRDRPERGLARLVRRRSAVASPRRRDRHGAGLPLAARARAVGDPSCASAR